MLFFFSVFEVLQNDTITEFSRQIQNGKVILCDDLDEMENNVTTSKLCKFVYSSENAYLIWILFFRS